MRAEELERDARELGRKARLALLLASARRDAAAIRASIAIRQWRQSQALALYGVINALELSPEARRVFSNDKTGPLLGGRHGWSIEHAIYSSAVRERLDQFLAERGIRPQDMSTAQAREFAASIRSSTDPRIRNFNLQIYRREFLYLIRRYRIRN